MAKKFIVEHCTECGYHQGLPKLDAIQVCGYNGGFMTLNQPFTNPPIVLGPGIPIDCPLEDA